jgi:N-acetylated-alpha-linked acidic dipeptidase
MRPLHLRVAQFRQAGDRLKQSVQRDLSNGQTSPEKIQQLNQQLMQVESNWLDPGGIPGRPWFQHVLYAARYTYAHLEFPGMTEAVEKKDWKLAAQQAAILDGAIEKNTELLNSASFAWERKQ